MRLDRGRGHVRLGRLIVTWPVWQGFESPVVDGTITILTRVQHARSSTDTTSTEERFGGVTIRPWWRPSGVAVSWLGARQPNPGRWLRWGFVRERIRWVLKGRPVVVPRATGGESQPMPCVLAGGHLLSANGNCVVYGCDFSTRVGL